MHAVFVKCKPRNHSSSQTRQIQVGLKLHQNFHQELDKFRIPFGYMNKTKYGYQGVTGYEGSVWCDYPRTANNSIK